MPRLRSALLLTVLALALTCLPGSSALGADPTAMPVMHKTATQLTEADLDHFLDLAYSNQITASQAQTFIAKLSPTQERTLRSLSEAKIGAITKTMKGGQP